MCIRDRVPLEILRPHEEILPKKVDQLEKMTHRWNAYTKPLLIDKSSSSTNTFIVFLLFFEIDKN